jgi:hypothetical protein
VVGLAEVERMAQRRGAWLISLEFEAQALIPSAILTCRDGRPVWMYQVPFNHRAKRGDL